jgi:hypothetical protein
MATSDDNSPPHGRSWNSVCARNALVGASPLPGRQRRFSGSRMPWADQCRIDTAVPRVAIIMSYVQPFAVDVRYEPVDID